MTFLAWSIVMFVWESVIGGVTLATYWYDKKQSKIDGWRVPEIVLHALSALGGSTHALVGMMIFNHKKDKCAFWCVNLILSVGYSALNLWLWTSAAQEHVMLKYNITTPSP